jgi:hypothetical protein
MGSGVEAITDDKVISALRRKGRSISVKSALGAAIITGVLLAI